MKPHKVNTEFRLV